MALIVKTDNPQGLLDNIYKAIDDKKIETWTYDSDGDFTHVPPQWYQKAWFHPEVQTGELRFGLWGQKNIKTSTTIYGVYHGRFIEMLLNHFDKEFSTAGATAQSSAPDNFD